MILHRVYVINNSGGIPETVYKITYCQLILPWFGIPWLFDFVIYNLDSHFFLML